MHENKIFGIADVRYKCSKIWFYYKKDKSYIEGFNFVANRNSVISKIKIKNGLYSGNGLSEENRLIGFLKALLSFA